MLTNILKSNRPAVIFLLIISAIALWLHSFIDPMGIKIPSDNLYIPLNNFMMHYFEVNSLLSVLFVFALVLIQAFLMIQFNKKYILINYRTYLPAFFYILISASFVHLQRINPVIIGGLFIFVSMDFIFNIYRKEYALNKVYLAGFFIAVASLFWAPFMVYILILFISLLILRPFIGREWIVGILGYLTPFLFVFIYYFVFFDQHLESVIDSYKQSLHLIKSFYSLHFSYYIFYCFLAFVIIIASYTIAVNYQKKKIRTRKYFEIYWWLFFISATLFIFFKNVSYEIIYIISIPVAYLLTDYFYTIKKSWFLNLILVMFIGAIVYIQITAH
ncbi:MAG: hypothetical protein KQH79_00495 [Bacteroidetes bacterium]|nr:hypothetical protein [Bacteroidota bacterium]